MADPGTVIGIVSLVGQLLRGLKSLHTFFGDIKDAPSDVQTLTQELSSVETILNKTLDQLNTINPNNRNTLLATAVRNCAEHVSGLENLTRPLRLKGHDGSIKRMWKQVATAYKKEDFQNHIAMLHGARLNIIAAQGAWSIDLHHAHATQTYELNQAIQALRLNQATDSAAISNKLIKLEKVPDMLEKVRDAVQKDDALALAHELKHSFQKFDSNAAVNTTELSNKLECVSRTLGYVNDAVQGTRAITIAGIEEFPSFMKPIVQAAVNNAVETQFQNMKIVPHFQQGSEDTRNTMSIKEFEGLKGKLKYVKRLIQSRHYSTMEKSYHFWFGKVRVETWERALSYENSNFGPSSSIHESFWHARILVLPAPWILNKGSLVTLEYITRENRKTSFHINTEPIRIIPKESPVFEACFKGDVKAVRQMIEGGQASRHDRDEYGWTLLDVTLISIGFNSGEPAFNSSMPFRARDRENLFDYLISIGVDPWEYTIPFFCCLASKYLRNCSDKKEHILRCFQKLISAPTPDLLDYNLIVSVITDFFVLDERYSQISLQLISRDDWPIDLGEVLSDPFYYYSIEFSHGNRSGRSREYFSAGSLDVKIREFLRKKSSLFLPEYYALMQFCFLEKTIMTGSFFVHHPVDEVCNEDREGRRKLFEKLLVESLTMLLKRGLCPRGALGGTTKFPNPDWLSLYPPTKIARDLGVVELWREALVRSGLDASDIIDECLYAGLIDLFDGLSYQDSENHEEAGKEIEEKDDDHDKNRHNLGLVRKAARMALTVMSSIV